LERTLGRRGAAAYRDWQAVWTAYRNAHPELAAELEAIFQGRLPDGWEQDLPTFSDQQSLATRAASGKVLKAIASRVAWFVGGSADLGASTKTLLDNAISVSATHPGGRNLHFGVREHGMAAIANGLALTGLRPYASTFLVFSDYLRPAMRLAAIMHQPVLFIFTHDSIGLGEDGPTHQPVEHLAACRAIPGLVVVRPADANEVVEAYRTILAWNNRPAALILTRQDVPTLSRQRFASAELLRRGAYVLADPEVGAPDVILIGTGSEVHICVAAYEPLVREGIKVRLVSMPSFELFAEQDAGYQESVLPASVWKRIAVEAGVKQGWERFLGPHGRFIGMESFGASAPHGDLYRYFEITPERVVAEVRRMM
jgi:transketolase